MKKVLFILILLIILSFSQVTQAQDIKAVAKVTYNQFLLKLFSNGKEVPIYLNENYDKTYRKEAESGIGYYFGGIYYLTKDLGIEGGFDWAQSLYTGHPLGVDKKLGITADKKESTETIFGPYLGLSYSFNQFFQLKGGLNYYYLEENGILKNKEKIVFDKTTGTAEGLGGMIAGDINYSLTNNILLSANLGYRFAKLDFTQIYNPKTEELMTYNQDSQFDMSGMFSGLSLVYNF